MKEGMGKVQEWLEIAWSRVFGGVIGLRRRLATILAILLAAFLAYHVVAGADGLAAYHKKKAEDHALEQQIRQLRQENSLLQNRVQRLKDDPDAIEHEARKMLHYVRPGEVIYKLNNR